MKYEDIERVNGQMTPITLGTGNRKKDYAMVPDRVKAFRKLFPDGFITTEIIRMEGGVVTMMTKVGFYDADGKQVILSTGLAQEEKGKGMVNSTSFIENCETSAVGRALGFMALGIDGGGICSAEELVNAITAQNQSKAEVKPPVERKEPKANVSVESSLPWNSSDWGAGRGR